MLRAARVLVAQALCLSKRERAKQATVKSTKHARDALGAARAGTTLLREPLPCERGACSGDEMSEDTEHWFIEELVWGPYQDALGQEVFLALVSGMDYFGQAVDGILWEQQCVDIPTKIVHAFMAGLSPDFPIGQQPAEALLAEA